LAKRKSRKDRIAALGASQEAELGRERDEIGLGRFGPSVPADLQIPTKIVRGELQADLEDEYFGGFGEDLDNQDDLPVCAKRVCGAPGYLGCRCLGIPEAKWRKPPPTWGRVWGRVDKTSERFAWAAKQHEGGGLVDGQTPPMHQYLKSRAAWPRFRTHSLPNRTYESPHLRQAIRQAEQKLPAATPEDGALYKLHAGKAGDRGADGDAVLAERGRAEDLDRLARRLDLLAAMTDPNSGPSRSFACGILHEEKSEFFAQHTARRVQALHTRRYRPSRALEAKRFPKLPKIKTKLLPKEELGKAERRIAMRGELEQAVASFEGATTQCPAETTTRMLNKRRVGRPTIGDRKMTDAERKQRQRAKLRVIVAAPPLSPGDDNVSNRRPHAELNTTNLDKGHDRATKSKTG
jgi:hypothetical protein